MKKLYLIGFLGAIWAGILTAQAQSATQQLSYSTGYKPSPKWVVKFAPLSLVDPSSTVEFAVERLVSQQHSVQAEFGYAGPGLNRWGNSGQNLRYSNGQVWRGRAEWRYYLRQNQAPFGSYAALEGIYKQVNALENGTVGIGFEAGQYQYYQMYSLPISAQVWAFNLKLGNQFPLSANNRLVGDFYGGVGLRHQTIYEPDRPDGYTFYAQNPLFSPFLTNRYPALSVSFGLKIGYTF
ncbi:hypothetical protein GCM10028805_47750 [Spirosoma harenae]